MLMASTLSFVYSTDEDFLFAVGHWFGRKKKKKSVEQTFTGNRIERGQRESARIGRLLMLYTKLYPSILYSCGWASGRVAYYNLFFFLSKFHLLYNANVNTFISLSPVFNALSIDGCIDRVVYLIIHSLVCMRTNTKSAEGKTLD